MGVFTITRMILRSLLKGPDTRRYPAVPAHKTAQTRGHLIVEIEKCIFCSLCSMHCPADAIIISKPARTWHIDRFRCINCGCCTEYCPKTCLHMVPEYLGPRTESFAETFTGPEPQEIQGQEAAPSSG
jgi:formate hydrogenlyase subunit 6/NADH:ubiquinone oxidoreductase subunit I